MSLSLSQLLDMEISCMHRHFENWNDMKLEPRKFWSAETIFSFKLCKIFQYTTSTKSQTPLLRYFLRGGEGEVRTQAILLKDWSKDKDSSFE